MKTKKEDSVIVYVNDCIRWSGGVNILIQIINSLINAESISYRIVYVNESFLMKILNTLRLSLRGGGYKNNKIIDGDLLNKFQSYLSENNLLLEKINHTNFSKNFINENMLPVMKISSSLKNKNLIGYIPDCQHLHLETFFLKRVIIYRNYQIRRIKKFCKKVYCTSENVKKDLTKHYNFLPENVYVTGFIPMRLEPNVKKLEIVDEEYFLIANQLWQHKNHSYAIEAFYDFLEKNNNKEIKLFCTGYIHDHRDETYSSSIFELINKLNLSDNVKFLGYLERREFIKYLISCKALIQPTLFEGSPGGFSVADAVAYGVPVLLSDIPINKEVDAGEVSYFDLSNKKYLTKLLEDSYVISQNNRYEKSEAISKQASIKLGQVIKELITQK